MASPNDNTNEPFPYHLGLIELSRKILEYLIVDSDNASWQWKDDAPDWMHEMMEEITRHFRPEYQHQLVISVLQTFAKMDDYTIFMAMQIVDRAVTEYMMRKGAQHDQ